MAIWDKVNKIKDQVLNTVNDISEGTDNSDEASKTIHDEFSARLSFTKNFAFRSDVFVYGTDAYPYSQLSEIKVINVPMSAMTNGAATVSVYGGKEITLAFEFHQKDRFFKALKFANEKIYESKGIENNVKYTLQSPAGSKLEVYDDHVQLSYIKTGISNVFENVVKGGATEILMDMTDINVQISHADGQAEFIFLIGCGNENFSLTLNAEDFETAKEAEKYILTQKETGGVKFAEPENIKTPWQPADGNPKSFTLCGEKLEISEQLDIFNAYRLRFRELAWECMNCAKAEYGRKVKNLVTYIEYFPRIYGYYLAMMCDKAMEIIIAEGLWTVTRDSFLEAHCKETHLAIDEYTAIDEGIALVMQRNQNEIAGIMSYVPNLVGGGFGLKGAAKGIAAATAFNIVRDAAESVMVSKVANLNAQQQAELYGMINSEDLFIKVFGDYWLIFITLLNTLSTNGKTVWTSTKETMSQAKNIFENLSNPNFPQDQLVKMFITILSTNPYDKKYHQFMISRFGENEETTAIKNYFGYHDFDDPKCII